MKPLLLSAEGLLDLDGALLDSPFTGRNVTAGASQDGRRAVIVDNHEIGIESGDTWTLAAQNDTVLNCLAWTPEGKLLVGTAAARLAWLEEEGLRFIRAFDAIPERSLWKTPWGGPPDTRSLAVATDGTLYANIHVGWICRSTDGGEHWENAREGLEMDVHEVSAHPRRPEIVLTATARGFHISHDRGKTFQRRSEGMPYQYQRACTCAADKDVMLVSTSRGPHGQADALLFRSEDEGNTWRQVRGLPEGISANIDTFQIAFLGDGQAAAIIENRHVYRSEDWGETWQKTVTPGPRLHAILA